MELISREDAQKGGLNYYFTGNPCKHGHLSKRKISTAQCHVCATLQRKNKSVSKHSVCKYCKKDFLGSTQCCSKECKINKQKLSPRPSKQQIPNYTNTVCVVCSGSFITAITRNNILNKTRCDNCKNIHIKIRKNKIPRLKINCLTCGKEFEAFIRLKGKDQNNLNKKYCSRRCGYSHTKIVRNCAKCKKQILLIKSKVQNNKSGLFYCSKECYKTHIKAKPLICTNPRCNKEFFDSQGKLTRTFCSLECNIDFRRDNPKPLISLTCNNCQTTFQRKYKGRGKNVYCSIQCAKDYSIKNRKTTLAFNQRYYGSLWRKMRKVARIRDSHTCQRCDLVQVKPALPVHHITPIRKFINPDDGNVLGNLITLCRVCHGAVEINGLDFVPTFNIATFNKDVLTNSSRPQIYKVVTPTQAQIDSPISCFNGLMRCIPVTGTFKITRWGKDLKDPSVYTRRTSRAGIAKQNFSRPLTEAEKQTIRLVPIKTGVITALAKQLGVSTKIIKGALNGS